MDFREETKYWITKGPRCNGLRRGPTLRENKSLNHEQNWETEDLNNLESEVKFNHSLMHKNSCNCKKGPKTWERRTSNVINNTLRCHPPIYCKSFSGSGVHTEYELFKQKSDSGEIEKKSVPVQLAERTGSAIVCNIFSDTSPFSCGEMTNRNSKEKIHPDSGFATTSDSRSIEHKAPQTTKMTSNDNEAPKFENKTGIAEVHASESTIVSMIYFEGPKGTCRPIIGSQVAAETLNVAYRLQLESERAQLEWGQPLAEFERFLHAASPVFSFSYRCAPCSVCSVSQLSSIFLCKHQMDNGISLCALWNWYQKPGNYGLEIKTVDYNNQKGMLTEMTPFQAHFIPFLSAIQLFGKVRPEKQEDELSSSSAKTLPGKYSQRAIQPSRFWVRNKTSETNLDSVEEVCISNNASQHKTGDSNCLAESELMFEFFESELPHERKPLHIKIAELVNTGTSNLAFGDPSKLKSLDLHDLHPASWYSVAWYPMYRIPEGNFRASFLTYHSLGHLVQRCVPTDSHQKEDTCIVAPVLGLESYNIQGECWFDMRMPDKTSLKEFSQCKSSDIPVKRFRALKENAATFA